jgi:hypothetical protein
MQVDSGHLKAGKDGRMDWQEALAWAEGLTYAGQSDWRLPNAKELQSLVDYGRCPDTTDSAAIDPLFKVSEIRNEAGKKDYPSYWTGTTHASVANGSAAVYVAFGRSLGWMPDRRGGGVTLLDVHGAGSQRSDPKAAFIRRLDKDGDGKVSRKEFDGPARHFDDFDKNGDGFIDASEAPEGPPPDRRGPPR